jgi:hypothetical protein
MNHDIMLTYIIYAVINTHGHMPLFTFTHMYAWSVYVKLSTHIYALFRIVAV